MLRKRVICTAQLWQLKTVVVQVRFIFPALLLFNIAAAAGLARLHQNRGKGRREQLAWWGCAGVARRQRYRQRRHGRRVVGELPRRSRTT